MQIAHGIFLERGCALLLVTHPDYDYAGALAWVYHLRKDHALQADAEKLSGGPNPPAAIPGLALIMAEMADAWEELSPGRGALIGRAGSELAKRKKGGPDNWLGKSIPNAIDQQAAATATKEKLRALPSVGKEMSLTYRFLCRDTHPWTRVRPKQVGRMPNGDIRIQAEQPDRQSGSEGAQVNTAAAIQFARVAMEFRAQRFPPGSLEAILRPKYSAVSMATATQGRNVNGAGFSWYVSTAVSTAWSGGRMRRRSRLAEKLYLQHFTCYFVPCRPCSSGG